MPLAAPFQNLKKKNNNAKEGFSLFLSLSAVSKPIYLQSVKTPQLGSGHCHRCKLDKIYCRGRQQNSLNQS